MRDLQRDGAPWRAELPSVGRQRPSPTFPGLVADEPTREFVPPVDAIARDVRPTSVIAALTAMTAADLTDVLPTIAVPTLLVWARWTSGRRDRWRASSRGCSRGRRSW
jgi:hypothetical protein